MKILYLHQYFNLPSMPGSVRSYEIARHLVSQGHEVHVITLCRENAKKGGWKTTNENGISIHWLPMHYSNKTTYFKRLVVFFKYAVFASFKAINIKGDVVFATSTPLTIAIPGVLASKFLKIPMVFEVRDLWPEVPIAIGVLKNPLVKTLAKSLEKFAYKNAAHIIALSPDMKRGIVDTGVMSEKVTVIPNFANLLAFKPTQNKKNELLLKFPEVRNRKVALYTGTFGYVNGLLYMVELAKKIKERGRSDICFIAIGDGIEYQLIYDEAKRNGVLNHNFFIHSPISKDDIPCIVNESDVVLSLVINVKSLWANSANKFFDALAAGKPVVINYNGWQADLLRKKKAGIVLSPYYSDNLAEEFLSLISDDKKLFEMGRAAHKLARERFDRDKLVIEVEDILLNVTGENNKG